MEAALPPCHRHPAFTHPIPGTPETEAAIHTCKTACPRLADCAEEALTAGDSIDGHVKRPAMDVIQAGIHCHGDQMTAYRLARIAGVDMPTVSDTTPRNSPPPYCRHCKSVMVGWTRGEVPPGKVMHYARGWCTNCRSHYRADLERNGTTGHYSAGRTRTRHERPQPLPDPQPEQLQLFGQPERTPR